MVEMNILRIPGPTPIHPRIQQAMNTPMIGHRSSDMKELMEDVKERIKPVFGTTNEVVLLTSSGTSSLEASVVNTTEKGDEVLVLVTGAFGERFAQICQAYELKVHRIDVPWGEAVNPDTVTEYLQKHPNIKAVFATYCETSTGVLNPIEAIGHRIKNESEALFIVDGVSAVGGARTEADKWGVDLFITGSQKAMMLPPGLSFIAMSEKAWRVIEENSRPRFYLDLQKYRASLLDNATPFTPAVSLIFGLQEVLTMMSEEGLEHVYARHEKMKQMTRAGIRALGLELLAADEDASPTVTSFVLKDLTSEQLRSDLKESFGLSLAGGPGKLKETVVRIGHMGYCTEADVLQVLSLLELSLMKNNNQIVRGAAVAAAQTVYLK